MWVDKSHVVNLSASYMKLYVSFLLFAWWFNMSRISVFSSWSVTDKAPFFFNHLLLSTVADSHLYLVLIEEWGFLFPHIFLSVAEWLQWRAAVCWPTVFHLSFVTGGHPPVCLIVADLQCFHIWLTGVKNGPASAIATVVVKETTSPVPLTWGNRTASCGQRCCRTCGRTRSSPTTSCRSGTRYGGTLCTEYQVIVMVLLNFSSEEKHFLILKVLYLSIFIWCCSVLLYHYNWEGTNYNFFFATFI